MTYQLMMLPESRCTIDTRPRPRSPGKRAQCRHRAAALAPVAFALALSACTAPPVKEFEGYAEAFEDVRSATYLLIQDYEAAISITKPAVSPVAEPPLVFDPSGFRELGEPTAADQRRRAIDAVVQFNEKMLALARGSSLESVKATLKPLSVALKFAAPEFSFASPLVEGLIGQLLQARDNAEFVRAFKEVTISTPATADCRMLSEGKRSGSADTRPIIEGIIEHLCADTVEYYDAQRGRMGSRLNALPAIGEMGAKLAKLGDGVARPRADSALGARLAQLEAEYHAVSKAVSGVESSGALVSESGSAPYTETTEASIDALMEAVRSTGEEARAIKRGLIDYHAALGKYVGLLDKTILLLRETQAAAARPPDVSPIAERLVVIRSEVDDDALGTREAILRAISALQ